MQKQMAEDAYIRCDILTGRVYRCLTSLFQDFLDIQMSRVYGERWIEQAVTLAEKLKNDPDNRMLNALLKKKEKKGLELMDKTCIDVTVANALMLYNLYYIVAVPQRPLNTEDMTGILAGDSETAAFFYMGMDDEQLHEAVMDRIRNDIMVAKECNNVMSLLDGKRNKQSTNIKIRNNTFYQRIDQLVKDKNQLNSHMSEVDDPTSSDILINTTIKDLREFLTYLDRFWEYEGKGGFIADYLEVIEEIEYLRYTNDFGKVVDSIHEILSKRTNGGEAPDPVPAPEPAKETGKQKDSGRYRMAVKLLGNKGRHAMAEASLSEESKTFQDPCAAILLAFMYRCRWAAGHRPEEFLSLAEMISEPTQWIREADRLKNSDREKALAYYLGAGMKYGNNMAYSMAGFLSARLYNFELTKECFRMAAEQAKKNGSSDPEAEQNYFIFSRFKTEEQFVTAMKAKYGGKG